MNVDTGQFMAIRGELAGLGERVADVDRRNEDAGTSAMHRVDYVLTEVVTGLGRLEDALGLSRVPVLTVIAGGGGRGRHAAPRTRRFRVIDGGRA